MTDGDPPEWADRYGRYAFLALALVGSAAVGLAAGGMAGYPLVGLAVCTAYPLWVLVRGSDDPP